MVLTMDSGTQNILNHDRTESLENKRQTTAVIQYRMIVFWGSPEIVDMPNWQLICTEELVDGGYIDQGSANTASNV